MRALVPRSTKAPDLDKPRSDFAAYKAAGGGHAHARTHVSNLLTRHSSPDPHPHRSSRIGLGFILWRPGPRNDLCSSNEAARQSRDRERGGPLNSMPRQRSRSLRARQGHRSVGPCCARPRHDAIRRDTRLGPIAREEKRKAPARRPELFRASFSLPWSSSCALGTSGTSRR